MKFALVKTEVVRDGYEGPYIRSTYVNEHLAKQSSRSSVENELVLVSHVDDEPPTLLQTVVIEEVEQKPETWLDRFFGNGNLAARTLTDIKEFNREIKARGLSLSVDSREGLAEFLQSECEGDGE